MFNGKIHYKWPFSIAKLNYQRVVPVPSYWCRFQQLHPSQQPQRLFPARDGHGPSGIDAAVEGHGVTTKALLTQQALQLQGQRPVALRPGDSAKKWRHDMEMSMDLMDHNGYHHYQMDVFMGERNPLMDCWNITIIISLSYYNPLDIICEWEIKHKNIYLLKVVSEKSQVHRFVPRRYDESLNLCNKWKDGQIYRRSHQYNSVYGRIYVI